MDLKLYTLSFQKRTINSKKYTFERVENFKYLGVILNEGDNHQTYLQERIKNAN